MKITTLDGKTPDIAKENMKKLKQLFPEVFTESKVDFEKDEPCVYLKHLH